MIRTALKVVGILLLFFVAYVAWVIFKAGSATGISPTTHSEVLSDRIRVMVTFPEADAEIQITEIVVSRGTGQDLGIDAPHGFRVKPYTPEDTGSPDSRDSIEWPVEANSEDVRWTGALALTPDAVTTLDFPIQERVTSGITIRFQYERKIGIGGQISFFSVPVEVVGH